MAMIQFTDPGAARRGHSATRALAQAAVAAGRAPSVCNSQPWRWRIADDVAELRADRERRLAAVDPDGRLLTISCGAALHHARTALAGDGFVADVARLPDASDYDLLARIWVKGTEIPERAAVRLRLAMALRHTDHRPFTDVEVPQAVVDRLREAAEVHGIHLKLLRQDEVIMLAVAASAAEFAGPRHRAQPSLRTGGPVGSADEASPDTLGPDGMGPDGMGADVIPGDAPADATPARQPRRGPLWTRDAGGRPGTAPRDLVERHACYAVLVAEEDHRGDWLAAGEALSAVLLTATDERLGASPISEVVEVPATRMLLRELLGGAGYPMVAVRLGVPGDGPLAAAARRAAAEVMVPS